MACNAYDECFETVRGVADSVCDASLLIKVYIHTYVCMYVTNVHYRERDRC